MKKFFAAILRGLKRLQYNSPVVLTFALLSFCALAADWLTAGRAGTLLFSVYRSSPSDPLTYVRLFAHVMGHANFDHYFNNFLIILLVGPALEEKHGSLKLLLIIFLTAVLTGLAHIAFSSDTRLMGASGVAFMMIVLSSFVGVSKGRVPLTLVLCILVYIGGQLTSQFSPGSGAANISYATHIVGGACGMAFGLWLYRDRLFPKAGPKDAAKGKPDGGAKDSSKGGSGEETDSKPDFIDLRGESSGD